MYSPRVQPHFYGFLLHVTNTVQYALIRKPEYQKVLSKKTFNRYCPDMLLYVKNTIKHEVGIPELRIDIIWTGNGTTGYCWVLPDHFKPEYRTEAESKSLKKLKKMMRLSGEPGFFAPAEEPEPEVLKDMGSAQEMEGIYSHGCIALAENLASGGVTTEMLVASYKMGDMNIPETIVEEP